MHHKSLAGWLIVFDLDGTLVDTAPDLVAALNYVLCSEALEPVRFENTRNRVGQGAGALIEYGAALSGARFSAEKIAALKQKLIDNYAENIPGQSAAFKGVAPMLQRLQDAGARFAICTNKEGELARKLLRELQLDHWFSAITGYDEVPNKKPHPDHFLACVAQARGHVNRSLMVGDSLSDVGTARNAGAPVVLVDFGYSPTPVREIGADAVISDFSTLDTVIARLGSAQRL